MKYTLTENDEFIINRTICDYKNAAKRARKLNNNCEANRNQKIADWLQKGLDNEQKSHFPEITEIENIHD